MSAASTFMRDTIEVATTIGELKGKLEFVTAHRDDLQKQRDTLLAERLLLKRRDRELRQEIKRIGGAP